MGRGSWVEGVEGVEGVFEIPLFHFFTIYYYYNEIVPITMITFTIHITINPYMSQSSYM